MVKKPTRIMPGLHERVEDTQCKNELELAAVFMGSALSELLRLSSASQAAEFLFVWTRTNSEYQDRVAGSSGRNVLGTNPVDVAARIVHSRPNDFHND